MDKRKPPKKSFGVGKPEIYIESSNKWTFIVLIISFIFSILFSAVTTTMLEQLDLSWAFVILFIIIGLNILFDMIGTATQTAQEKPFHSLAARKVPGASDSVQILRHAPQVANFCNDIIGDIAGIISGGAAAIIVAELAAVYGIVSLLPSLILTGLVSSLTIGGKAFCKTVAMKNSNSIIFIIGKIVYYVTFPFRGLKKGRK